VNKMEAVKILTQHNKWRRGSELKQIDPELIGYAIDFAIEFMKKRHDVKPRKRKIEKCS
jgi:hypothetical protein